MELTDEQQQILDGKKGPFLATCLKWLVEWGDAMGARRLIPVTNTHALVTVPGNLIRDAGQAALNQTMDLLRSACQHRVCCHSTTHITFAHEEQYDAIHMPAEQVAAQAEVMELARHAGFLMTYTCAPYIIGNVPIKGEICAWTESSAVVYANSILGARTTRHGTESAIAAALTGYVPEFGVLLDENRKATIQIDVTADLKTPTDWGALGYFAGKAVGLEIPVFNGTPRPLQDDAKQLCAALASGGGVTMCHVAGVTPEAATLSHALGNQPPNQKLVFGPDERRDMYSQLRNQTGDRIDTVILGCPHASLREVAEIGFALKEKQLADGVRLWVCMAYATRANAERMGFAKWIQDAGGILFCDTCPTNSMVVDAKRLVTTGFKQAHYARSMIGCEVIIDNLSGCIRAALTGRWTEDE